MCHRINQWFLNKTGVKILCFASLWHAALRITRFVILRQGAAGLPSKGSWVTWGWFYCIHPHVSYPLCLLIELKQLIERLQGRHADHVQFGDLLGEGTGFEIQYAQLPFLSLVLL